MPSTNAGRSDARGLRDQPLGRLLILVVVLLGAFAVSRSCAASGTNVSQQEAIQIARKHIDFRAKCSQIRYLRRGLKSQPVWAVSLWTLDRKGRFDRVAVVLVAARNGRVLAVTNRAAVQATSPQCSAPV
jgi:hypothetical protein